MAWYDYIPSVAAVKYVKDKVTSNPYDAAAQGAQQGSNMAAGDASLQYQRQMQGLDASLQQVNGYKSLYDQIYGTHTAQSAAQLNQITGGVGNPVGQRAEAVQALFHQANGAQPPAPGLGRPGQPQGPRPSQMPAWMQAPAAPPSGGGGSPLTALFAQSK